MLSAVRNFIIVFAVAALIFGTVAYFITGLIAENIAGIADSPDTADTLAPDASESVTDPGVPEFTPVKHDYPDLDGDSFNILFIGTDYRPNDFDDYMEDLTKSKATLGLLTKPIRTVNADFLVLVCINEDTRRAAITCIPASTRVSCDGEYRLLSTCYDRYGAEGIVNFVNFLTAVPIDFYTCANVTDAGKLIDLIDGVDMMLPTDVYNPYYHVKKNSGMTGSYDLATKIAIDSGDAHIDSSNIFPLLHYRTSGIPAEGEHEAVLTSLALSCIRKSVSVEYIGMLPELFSRAAAYTETNLSPSSLAANMGIIRAYDEFEVITVTYPGTSSMLGENVCFIPDTTTAYQSLRSALGGH